MSSPSRQRPQSARARPQSARARPQSAKSTEMRKQFYGRDVRPKSAARYRRSGCGVSMLVVDTERDAGLIRQYEGGLARVQSARTRCYNKYVPKLTDKEKKWLGIDAEGLQKTQQLVNMSKEEWVERAKAQEALAQEMHRKREEMVDSNLEKMHMAAKELRRSQRLVYAKCQERFEQKRQAWLEDMEKERNMAEARQLQRDEDSRRLLHLSIEYKQAIEEKNRKHEEALQAKLQGIRQEMERSKQEEEERWHKRMETQRAWKADMDKRFALMASAVFSGSKEISALKSWEEDFKAMVDADNARRSANLEKHEEEQRERSLALKRHRREMKEKQKREFAAKRQQWREDLERERAKQRALEEHRNQLHDNWRADMIAARRLMNERVDAKRALYRYTMGLGPKPEPNSEEVGSDEEVPTDA